MRVLITDSHYKHALAAVRDLGRNGIEVFCTSDKKINPTSFSVYCKGCVRIPRNLNEKQLFNFYKNLILEKKIDVVLPIGYHSNIFFSKYLNDFKKIVNVPISEYKKISIASDKKKTLEFAAKIKVNTPKTVFIKNIEEIKKYRFNFPVVIKSVKEMMGKKVMYAKNEEELRNVLEEKLKYGTQIVQEYVDGPGRGFFALCKDGKVIVSFQHERIREYPYTGGISSCAKSIYDKRLEKIGRLFLEKLKWNGVAMLEFRYDKKRNLYKLLEMNPKFWGSLDLAIASGVSFPYLAAKMALGCHIKDIKYKIGQKFQWLLPEDTATIKTSPEKIKTIRDYFCDLLDPKVKKDVSYFLEDSLPTLIRMAWTVVKFFI
jgi:predicted ATP-grasp superfamily ATP-dependent carboligase